MEMLPTDDHLLVLAAEEGDRAALGMLVQRHPGLALRLCRRLLNDEGLAEDAGQEAWLEADARPSDAINLALLTGAPLLVDPSVLKVAAQSDRARACQPLTNENSAGAAAIAQEAKANWTSRLTSRGRRVSGSI